MINRILVSALLAGAMAVPAMAALMPGDKAPDFKAKAAFAGKEIDFSLADALKKGPVVVYFYPSAFTGGCNLETKAFADAKEKFDAVKTTIVGVSGNSIDALKEYSADEKYCGSKFTVASDIDGSIAKAYALNARAREELLKGNPDAKDSRGQEIDAKVFIDRTTFVIMPDGKVAATLSTDRALKEASVKPAEHAEKSLAVIAEHKH